MAQRLVSLLLAMLLLLPAAGGPMQDAAGGAESPAIVEAAASASTPPEEPDLVTVSGASAPAPMARVLFPAGSGAGASVLPASPPFDARAPPVRPIQAKAVLI